MTRSPWQKRVWLIGKQLPGCWQQRVWGVMPGGRGGRAGLPAAGGRGGDRAGDRAGRGVGSGSAAGWLEGVLVDVAGGGVDVFAAVVVDVDGAVGVQDG